MSRTIETLSPADCRALASFARVGRLVHLDGDGPAAIPVNFAVVDGDIVFRVEPGSGLRHVTGSRVGFEVDRIEPAERLGWSVLFRGEAEEIPIDDVPDILRSAGSSFPQPWAAGVHSVWIRVRVDSVSGRRLTEPYFSLAY